jgi:predicted phage-related endonuclease
MTEAKAVAPSREPTTVHPEESSELRARGIGSSDAPKIANLVKWRTPYQLYMERIGLVEPQDAGEAAYWGTKLEPVILSNYAEQSGLNVVAKSPLGDPWYDVHKPDGSTHSVRFLDDDGRWKDAIDLVKEVWHSDIDYMLAHLDGVACSDDGRIVRVVEAKTAGIWIADEFGKSGTDEIPDRYLVQVNHAAEVLRSVGVDVPVDVPTLIAGQEHRLFTVERNDRLVKVILQMNAEFWVRLQEHDPPDIDGSPYTKEILSEIYPDDDGTEQEIGPNDFRLALVQRYRELQLQEKDAKYQTEQMRNVLKSSMETSSRWQGGNWSISYRRPKGRLLTDWKQIVRDIRPHLDEEILNEIIDSNTAMITPKRKFHPSLTRLALPAPQEDSNERE